VKSAAAWTPSALYQFVLHMGRKDPQAPVNPVVAVTAVAVHALPVTREENNQWKYSRRS
jgi:hypothetical protein